MSRTVTFKDEQFALIRERAVTGLHHHVSATITFYEPDGDDNAPDWMVTGIEVESDLGSGGWFDLQHDDLLYKLIVDLIETHESEAIAELIAAELSDEPDYRRHMREHSTLNAAQQFGSAA
jgi:hypothetical protein